MSNFSPRAALALSRRASIFSRPSMWAQACPRARPRSGRLRWRRCRSRWPVLARPSAAPGPRGVPLDPGWALLHRQDEARETSGTAGSQFRDWIFCVPGRRCEPRLCTDTGRPGDRADDVVTASHFAFPGGQWSTRRTAAAQRTPSSGATCRSAASAALRPLARGQDVIRFELQARRKSAMSTNPAWRWLSSAVIPASFLMEGSAPCDSRNVAMSTASSSPSGRANRGVSEAETGSTALTRAGSALNNSASRVLKPSRVEAVTSRLSGARSPGDLPPLEVASEAHWAAMLQRAPVDVGAVGHRVA